MRAPSPTFKANARPLTSTYFSKVLVGINYLSFTLGKPAALYDTGSPDWAPNKELGHAELKSPDPVRYLRQDSRRKRQLVDTTSKGQGEMKVNVLERDAFDFPHIDIAHIQGMVHTKTQTDATSVDLERLEAMWAHLQKEVLALKESKRALSFRTEQYVNSCEKVQYFTGLPTIQVLRVVHNFCFKIVDVNVNSVLSTFQEIVFTCCRLLLNLDVRDAAYRFEISVPTVSKVFQKLLDVLFNRLGKFIK